MDISKTINSHVAVLDAVAKEALGSDISGVTVNSKQSIINLATDTTDNRNTANNVLDNYGGLTVTADKTAMTEGDADPVISCNDAAISGDADVNYIVLMDGEEYASGTDTVTAGLAQLTLSSPADGVYEVYIYRNTGNYASGHITITVSEA